MKVTRWILIIAIPIVILFILFSGTGEKVLTVGEYVPDFRLTDLSGDYFFLNNYRGKVILLNFSATWCTYCLEELPYLEDLKQKYSKRGLIVASVFKDHNNINLIRDIKEKNQLTFPVLTDRKGGVFNGFRVRALPCTIIIDRSSSIRYIHTGFLFDDLQKYEREISSLL